MFFRYLHSLYLVEVIMGPDPKKLISTFYSYLLLPAATNLAYQLKSWWVEDVGELAVEDWDEVLETCKLVSLKLSNRLTHLYIFYRSYLMPIHLSKYQSHYNPECPRCGETSGTFYRLM